MNVHTVSPWAWAMAGLLARLHLHDLLERPDLLRVIAWKDIRDTATAYDGATNGTCPTGEMLDATAEPLQLLAVLDRVDAGDREGRWVLQHARELDRLRPYCGRGWGPTCRECAE